MLHHLWVGRGFLGLLRFRGWVCVLLIVLRHHADSADGENCRWWQQFIDFSHQTTLSFWVITQTYRAVQKYLFFALHFLNNLKHDYQLNNKLIYEYNKNQNS